MFIIGPLWALALYYNSFFDSHLYISFAYSLSNSTYYYSTNIIVQVYLVYQHIYVAL
jgi:hypothetical protein